MAKYKPGQFVKVNKPGKYRMRKSSARYVCRKCALLDINIDCDEVYPQCATEIGLDGYIEEVK